jgi:carotenoid cleavage dioxygenase-like enzyme
MPKRRADQGRPSAVPFELGGKWVAWNAEHTRIVAHAETLQQLWQAAQEKQIDDPIFEKVPRADVRFVGAR